MAATSRRRKVSFTLPEALVAQIEHERVLMSEINGCRVTLSQIVESALTFAFDSDAKDDVE